MQTWLDWYTKGAKDRWEETRRMNPALDLPEATDDFAAMAYLTRFAADLTCFSGLFQPPGVTDTPTAEHLLVFDALLLPFFDLPGTREVPNWPRATALAPTRGLVHWLAGADAPDDGGEAERLLRQRSLYVDLPDGALLVGPWTVRAMMTMVSDHPNLSVALVLTPRGSNRAVAVLEWMLGHSGSPHGATIVDVDAAEACHQAEQFLRLLVLYGSVADADRRGNIPHMPAEQQRANPRRAAQRAKKFSLFRVQTLDTPREAADLPRAPRQPLGDGHRLDVRVAVRPHFRWQAHGPRWTLRKLILIDGFWRGPEDGRVRAPIVRLDAPHPRRRPQAGDRQPTACRRDAHGIRGVAPDHRGVRGPDPCPMEPITMQWAPSGGEATPGTHGAAEAMAVEIPAAGTESGACS